MNPHIPTHGPGRKSRILGGLGWSLFCGFLLLVSWSAWATPDQARLHELRAERRLAHRSAQAAKTRDAEPLLFGLLVVPVDFADKRLPDTWQPAQHLGPLLQPESGETLRNYFKVASQRRLDLRITIAPVVHLSGARLDYSDIGLNGFTRTRALAAEALEAVVRTGLDLRLLDMDGPDRLPGTADDDGQVDGILLLHAGIGQENDPTTGRIQALQFYLDEPVQSNGIQASFYATASLHSGLGIWAHETGHLLGLEDRYDPLMQGPDDSEVLNSGGLGRFSLMAAGAWGTGGGAGAALPDGYSASQLGWYDVRDLPARGAAADTLRAAVSGGEVLRIWTDGRIEDEYFLLETRDPAAAAPFDAALTTGQLLVYHIDESVPAGGYVVDGPSQWHLRAHLVEADGNTDLRDGLDEGGLSDLFPGSETNTAFGPLTTPASDGHAGASGVEITQIASLDGAVTFHAQAAIGPSFDLDFSFSTGTEPRLQLKAHSRSQPVSDLTLDILAIGAEPWGEFADGGLSVTRAMTQSSPGVWVPAEPVVWQSETPLPEGALTMFQIELVIGAATCPFDAAWVWQGDPEVLDFTSVWPGNWSIDPPSGTGTIWHRWSAAPWLTDDGSPVLVCTGTDYTDASYWPDISYSNNALATLTSGYLSADVLAVRLLHALAVEMISPGVVMDGALVVWVAPDGRERSATPVGGWPGTVSAAAENPRLGSPSFADPAIELVDGRPIWRSDIFQVPDAPGPWRLRLILASNGLWRREGWIVADVEALYDPADLTVFDLDLLPLGSPVPTDLAWTWTWSIPDPRTFYLQEKELVPELGGPPTWHEVWSGLIGPLDGTYTVAWNQLHGLATGPRARHELRLIGEHDKGLVATDPVVVYSDGGAGTAVMTDPWPNPTTGEVRFMLSIDGIPSARLAIYDVRGRLVKSMPFTEGQHLVVWPGDDAVGQRVASGVYYLRLSWNGYDTLRKVVLIH